MPPVRKPKAARKAARRSPAPTAPGPSTADSATRQAGGVPFPAPEPVPPFPGTPLPPPFPSTPGASTPAQDPAPAPPSKAHVPLERRMERIDRLKPHPRNYREHPADQLAHIKESIKRTGIYRNVVIANDGTILAGHGVVLAARELGVETIPVIELPIGPDDPTALKVLTGDNEIGHLGVIDDRRLSEILREIKDADITGLAGTGYDDLMLASLVFVTRPDGEIKDFNAAAMWAGMPGYEEGTSGSKLVISFLTPQDRERFIEEKDIRIDKAAIKGNTWSTRWPWRDREDVGAIRFVTGPEQKQSEPSDQPPAPAAGKKPRYLGPRKVYERLREPYEAKEVRVPIYIPSKGRAEICLTPSTLQADGIPFKLVVEEQESDTYRNRFGSDSVLVLPESSMGIAYSRRWIKEHSKANGETHHWQIDDDVRSFQEKTGGRKEKCSAKIVLGNIEEWALAHSNVAIAGPLQTTWEWDGAKPKAEFRLNRPPVSCVLLSNAPKPTWRDGIFQDMDYAMQVLTDGWCTACFTYLLMDLLPFMKQPGGQTPLYKTDGKRKAAAEVIAQRWPGMFKVGERFGLGTLLPSRVWSKFTQQPIRITA